MWTRRFCAALALQLICTGPSLAVDRIYALGDDPVDPKEWVSLPKVTIARGYLPEAVDLSARFPEPGDQGKTGSCVAWATAYATRSYYNFIEKGTSRRDAGSIASPAYLYAKIRDKNQSCQTSGSNIVIALKYLEENGVPALADYGTAALCETAVPSFPASRLGFRVKGLRAVQLPTPGNPAPRASLDKIKQELATGNPVLFSMKVDRKFMRLSGANIYRSTVKERRDGDAGSHAMTMVGYDDQRQAFRVINSWGRDWADDGFGWISYDSYLKDSNYAVVMDAGVTPPKPDPVPGRDAPNPNACDDKGTTPWPACEAYEKLSKPLTASSRPRIETSEGKATFKYGDTLSLTVTAPNFPSFLYLVYLQTDGTAVNLLPRRGAVRQQVARNSVFKFGDGEEGRSRFRVGAPAGPEVVIAIASRSPIAELEALESEGKTYRVAASAKNPQTNTESPPERAFLSALQTGLAAQPDPSAPQREVSAEIFRLTVEP